MFDQMCELIDQLATQYNIDEQNVDQTKRYVKCLIEQNEISYDPVHVDWTRNWLRDCMLDN